MNKRLFKIISLALIHAFMMLDFGFSDLSFTDNDRCGKIVTSLSPQLEINKELFQKAYSDYGQFGISYNPGSGLQIGHEITNLPQLRLSKLKQKKYNIYPQRTRVQFDAGGRIIRAKDNLPVEQTIGFPGTWFVREESKDYEAEKSSQQKEAAKMRIQSLIAEEFFRRFRVQDVFGEITIRDDVQGITIKSSRDSCFLQINIGINLIFAEKERIQALIAEAFNGMAGIKTETMVRKNIEMPLKKNKKSPSVLFVDFFDARDARTETLAGPSLGNMFLAMSLRKEGMNISFVKGTTDAENSRIIECINLEKIDVMAISMITPSLNEIKAVQDFVRAIRAVNKDVVIALGGPSVTLAPDLLAQHIPEANVIIAGEAEGVFKKALVSLAGQKASQDLSRQTAFKLTPLFGAYLRFGKTSLAANLDYLNYFYNLDEAMKEFKIDFGFLNKSDVQYGLTLITSRGCPYRCSFCAQIMGPVYRTFSVDSVKEFLTAYKERVSALYEGNELSAEFKQALTVWFVDDDMFIQKSRGMEILKITQGLGLTCGSLAVSVNSFFKKRDGKKIIDESLFESLAKINGLGRIAIGVDGFTDREIRRLGKGGKLGYSMNDVERVIELCEKYKIKNTNFFILINSDTTWADFWDSFFRIYSLAKSYRFFGAWGNNFLEYYVHTPSFRNLISRPDFKEEGLIFKMSFIDGFPESNIVVPVWYRQNLSRVSTQKIGGRFSSLINEERFPIEAVINEALVYMLVYNDSDNFGFNKNREDRDKIIQLYGNFIDTQIKDVNVYLERIKNKIAFQAELTSDVAEAEKNIGLFMFSLESLLLMREILKTVAGKSSDDELKREIAKIEKFLAKSNLDISRLIKVISDCGSRQMRIFFAKELLRVRQIIDGKASAWEYIAERFNLGKEIDTYIRACMTSGISLERVREALNITNLEVEEMAGHLLRDIPVSDVMPCAVTAFKIKNNEFFIAQSI
ncbi:MAG: cobalamin-dependent protein [Candidatus Omnitrophica bacterium]|nr:cobalamin-dependent protein [Candidatus Omnitrophota bacterium]